MMCIQPETKALASELEQQPPFTEDYEEKEEETVVETIALSVSDLTFRDEDDKKVNIQKGFSYRYEYGEKLYPQLSIYYKDMFLGYAYNNDSFYAETNYFTSTFYKLNSKGVYKKLTSGKNDCYNAGTYQIVLKMNDVEIDTYDENGNNIIYKYHLEDSITIDFKITPRNIKNAEFTQVQEQNYTGNPIYPRMALRHQYNNGTMRAGGGAKTAVERPKPTAVPGSRNLRGIYLKLQD